MNTRFNGIELTSIRLNSILYETIPFVHGMYIILHCLVSMDVVLYVNDFMCHCTHHYYEYKKTSFKEKFEA